MVKIKITNKRQKMANKRHKQRFKDIPIGLYRKVTRGYGWDGIEYQIELDLLQKQLNIVEASE